MYTYEKDTKDLVINGWERGIGDSPHKGLGDLKCLNISTMSGEVSVNYGRTQQSQTPISGGTINASGSGATLTYSGTTALLPGTWVSVAGGSTITNFTSTTGFASGSYFYVKSVSGSSLTLALSYGGATINNFGTTGTATFSTLNMGKLVSSSFTSSSTFPNFQYFVLDTNGIVWVQDLSNFSTIKWAATQPTIGGNSVLPGGIFCFGNYLISVSDYLWVKPVNSLSTAWVAFTGAVVPRPTFQTNNFPHPSVLLPSGWVVICDGYRLDTLAPVAGSTFDPTDATTYSWNGSVNSTPGSVNYAVQTNNAAEQFQCIALIGNGSAATGGSGGATNVLVGGLYNYIYPWAPGTSFFQPTVFVAESYIQQMITVNNLVYVFAGSKGNMYITNGSSVTSVISIPDYIANSLGATQDPYFIWGGTAYIRGRIWFSAQAANCGGVWSFIPTQNAFIQQDVGTSLRLEHQNSYGTYAGMATILFTPQKSTDQQAEGVQYFAGWFDGSSTYGMDFSGTTPYTNGAAIIETDLIPTGTMLNSQTFSQIEYKLSASLASVTTTAVIPAGATSATLSTNWVGTTGTQTVTFSDGETKTATFTNGATTMTWSGGLTNAVTATILTESVTIKWRTSLTSAWATTGSDMILNPSNATGYFVPNFEFTQWIQLQVILQSTTNNPSYCRFKEIRIRS